jgi:hypothetical protein
MLFFDFYDVMIDIVLCNDIVMILGMIPSCVAPVMKKLSIIGLCVQRYDMINMIVRYDMINMIVRYDKYVTYYHTSPKVYIIHDSKVHHP